jgi:hypothetical protein
MPPLVALADGKDSPEGAPSGDGTATGTPLPSRHRKQRCPEKEITVSTSTPPVAERRSAFRAASPLLFDVAVPVGLYYLLSAAGVADTPALIVSGLVPFARSVYGVLRTGKADYLAVMVATLCLPTIFATDYVVRYT